MRLLAIAVAVMLLAPLPSVASTILHDLSSGNFSQDWTNTALIAVDDDWSGVPSIVGYRGDSLTAVTAVDPQTVVLPGIAAGDVPAGVVDIDAQQLVTFISGGVAEFELANPVVGLQGSGTADAPFLILYMNATGRSNVTVSYNLRDVDSTTDNSVQPVALQYRTGGSGNFTNVPAGFVADASTGPSLATLVTPVSVSLPAWNSVADLQFRIITNNAGGNDEWIGIDDITVTSVPEPASLSLVGLAGLMFAGLFRRRS